MTFYAFDDSWYAGIIERFAFHTEKEKTPNASIDCHGQSVIVAACILAQSIDQLARAYLKASNIELEPDRDR